MKNITFTPATEQLKLLHSGVISAVDLLEIYISRYELHNAALNAIVTTDFKAAREQARLADKQIKSSLDSGAEVPPLLGLPMTIKDTIEVTGMVTSAGSLSMKDYRPLRDATVVERLRKAGAIIFGKTNTPFFAMDFQSYNKLYGTTNNPWDLKRSPGGSSGGAAAALAAGLTALEIGSDLGGSIRNPASYCGVYGHKSSFEIVPGRGHIPPPPGVLGSPDLAVLGPLTRSADDLELALNVIAGPEDRAHSPWQIHLNKDRPDTLADYRVATLTKHPLTEVDESVLAVINDCVDALGTTGCSISKETAPDIDLKQAYYTYFGLMAAMIGAGLPASARRSFKLMKPIVRLLQKLGLVKPVGFGGLVVNSTGTHQQWALMDGLRLQMKQAFTEFFRAHDVLLCPVTATPAFEHMHKGSVYSRSQVVNGKKQAYSDHLVWAGMATLCGLPSTVAPIGKTADGLPVGIQIIGDFGRDLLTIDFARKLAAVVPAYQAPEAYTE